MLKQQAKQLQEKIQEYNSIVIFRHRSPDLDAVGSQMALKEAILQNYPYKNVYAFGDEKHYEFDFIAPFDQVDENVISQSLVIVTDTANADRVSANTYLSGKEIIKIDHHQDVASERYGDINIVHPEVSSTCELLFYLTDEFVNFRLNQEVARRLFIGMYADTGGFAYPNTKSSTFNALANLVEFDFDYEQTVSNLRVYDYDIIKAVGYAYSNITIEDGVGYIYFSKDVQEQLSIKPHQVSQVANFLGSIKQLEAWLVFNQYPKFTRVNMRSRKQFDISKVANNFEGGGHKNASGAMVYTDMQRHDIILQVKELVSSVR